MSKEITAQYAKKAQGEAEWAYEKAKEKFYYSMLEDSLQRAIRFRDLTDKKKK